MKLWKMMMAACAIASAAAPADSGSGVLLRTLPDGKTLECPLKHTNVKAEISGPMAGVTVRQDFVNEGRETIEAVYNFPLPVMAAVDGYEIHVNDRVVKGKIARREDAQRAYDEAWRRGQTAALLNQQRPNVFQQFIANITPGAKVSVEIHYVELVPYEAGTYEFVFPMVVGPRYFPQSMANQQGTVNPPIAPKGMRAGHDISIQVKLGMATALGQVTSESHAVTQKRFNNWFEEITLAQAREIPNKDFLLKYRVASREIAPSLLTHRTGENGYFSFVVDPPSVRTLEANIAPKELVFVIDTSGSMHGFPLDKAKEAMLQAIDGLNQRDTFNLITFSGDTDILWPQPVAATPENVARAKQFLTFKRSGGGTEMMKAIRAALDGTDSQEHVRIVCFMTDGYVGNDNEIIAEIRKHSNARVFSFGIGASVNRFLLDKMAEAGRGEVEYVSLNSDGSAAAKRFHERVRNPLLTDVEIDWNGLPVSDVVPARIPDLFSAKPIIVSGRYHGATTGKIRIRGRIGARPYERFIEVKLPAVQKENGSVPTLWARRKIDAFSMDSETHKEAITKLGLDYGLMTAYTSFYAIEERIVNEGGQMRRLEVPVEMPEGVSHEGIMGRSDLAATKMVRQFAAAPAVVNLQESAKDIREREVKVERVAGQRISVRVMLKDSSPATWKVLRELGFIADPAAAGARFITGSIDASKLEEFRKLQQVLRVEEIQ
jgi:Ca-activated chloride channel family protein